MPFFYGQDADQLNQQNRGNFSYLCKNQFDRVCKKVPLSFGDKLLSAKNAVRSEIRIIFTAEMNVKRIDEKRKNRRIPIA
jgi:hypothetical protein